MPVNHSLGIALGRTCIGIRCQDQAFLAESLHRYGAFLTPQEPEFWIELDLRQERTVAEVRGLLPQMRMRVDGEGFATEPELLRGTVDWPAGVLRVQAERALFSLANEYRLMNALLRGLYYGIYKRKKGIKPDAYLVHGCGVLGDGRGYLFTGPSGAGKTTVARMARGRRVLNDEVVLAGDGEGRFYVAGTPFDGGIVERCNLVADLHVVLLLRHGPEVSVRKLGGAEAYKKLLAQTIEAMPLLDTGWLTSLRERADFCAALAGAVPCYELTFRLDDTFWPVVKAL